MPLPLHLLPGAYRCAQGFCLGLRQSCLLCSLCVCVCPPRAIRFKNTIRCNLCNRQVEHSKGNWMWKSRRFCPGSLQTGLAHTTGPSFRVSSSTWSASELSLLCNLRKLMGRPPGLCSSRVRVSMLAGAGGDRNMRRALPGVRHSGPGLPLPVNPGAGI